MERTTTEITMTLLVEGEGVWTVLGTFGYEASDPLAVRLAMSVDGAVVEWLFARELLADGLTGPAGLGDVHLYPHLSLDGLETVRLELSAPDGQAVLEMPAGEVAQFLDATYQVVPLGAETEHLDVEGTLVGLLAKR